METAATAFVRAHTTPGPAPFVPEVTLHQARDAFGLWEQTERVHGGGVVCPPPFWAFAWAGGQALARYLLDNTGLVAGRDVFDLAAGSGLVAIAAAKAGAAGVAASEIDGYAAAAIALNAAVNEVSVAVHLDDVLDRDRVAASLVLAGDVFYSAELARRVLAFLDRARAAGATVLVGDPGRAYLPRERLALVASYRVPVSRALEDADVKEATVWRLAG
ncbi:MAG TPA: 50S ribosomal protein L11 methyltransferase [Rugosimonospora sp.]|nr:50S ribosomal protein L11 methyltransferase [Rugosimonospora sp.]